ncbi:hypothetical protein [Halopiger djelfimassiliensis]|uniref:hypothetical protein n=1 Tax=Halopiger djelfimassiliensis TaxID=1293047 RepID=UPI000677D77D|nr:hypothetical protein [Halopiger djelfimassiliensis]
MKHVTGSDSLITSKRLAMLGMVVVLVATAGCLGSITGVFSDEAAEPAEHAPEGSDLLVHADMAMMEDGDNQRIMDALVQQGADTDGHQDAFAEFENETGLDPEDAQQVLFFADLSKDSMDENAGFVVYSDWDTDTVISAVEDDEDTDYEQTEYEGESVLYEPTEEPEFGSVMYVGDLGDGKYVFGDEKGVRSSLAIEYGDGKAVSGDVRDAYDDTRDGHVTMAATLPDETVPNNDDPFTPNEIDFEPFHNVSTITGVYYTDDGNAGLEMQLNAETEDDAIDVADVTDGAISVASGSLDDDDLKDELRKIETEQDGSTVDVTYETSVDKIVELLEREDL